MIDVVAAVGLALAMPSLLTRIVWLAPTRLGGVFYYSNVLSDFLWKRLRLPRGSVELLLFAAGVILVAATAGSRALAMALLLALFGLELAVRYVERKVLVSVYARPDARRRSCKRDQRAPEWAGSIPDPSFHPDLVVNLRGPFVRRMPRYELGDLAVGRSLTVEVLVANHCSIPTQLPCSLELRGDAALDVDPNRSEIPRLASGEVARVPVRLTARSAARGVALDLRLTHADHVVRVPLHVRSIFEPGELRVSRAGVRRYPGAARAAFAWRGDMDLYDTVTFQSIDGLEHTLGLAARYRFPQTMFLSTRLSLDPDEAEAFVRHFGVDRGQAAIPRFIAWLKENVELQHDMTYPFVSEKPYLLELGNHMHLHYGTDAAACAGNDWQLEAGIGCGTYPWVPSGSDSPTEQRDNALAARRAMEQHLGFTPKSWATPDSTNDPWTAAAVAAAGCEVTSDADAKHWHNVIFQPPPHHPSGTEVVELTKRYPGDPQDLVHWAMILYWLHRGQRRGVPVIFMGHQHLRLYEGHACTRFTEALLRYVLTRFNGDLYIDTVHGIGAYWRVALSPKTRKVTVTYEAGGVWIRNAADIDLTNVPIDVEYTDGRRTTFLLDLPAASSALVDVRGEVKT